jgi:hypothetical protein
MTDDERQDHEAKADEVERGLDEMQERSERLQGEIEDTGDEWERRKRDSGVPGAAGAPEEAQGPEPEAEYPTKDEGESADGGESGDAESDEAGSGDRG